MTDCWRVPLHASRHKLGGALGDYLGALLGEGSGGAKARKSTTKLHKIPKSKPARAEGEGAGGTSNAADDGLGATKKHEQLA